MTLLALNAGSSSLKFCLYEVNDRQRPRLQGVVEGLQPQGQPRLIVRGEGSDEQNDLAGDADTAFAAALTHLAHWAQGRGTPLQAVAHRVVHGGRHYRQPLCVDAGVLADLRQLIPLAPLHQPHNLLAIERAAQVFPGLPQIAVFDTAFHADLPEVERAYALPQHWRDQGVARYGFHGLSYTYLSRRLAALDPAHSRRVLLAHLGNGASVCAVRAGRSVATSMGFSALEGLVMGTRTGNLDAGILLYLLEQGLTHDAIQDLLYRQSGLLGLSGISADMRALRASPAASAAFAIDVFSHRLLKEMGGLAALLGGVDAIVFSAGIGEHDAQLRHELMHKLAYLGVQEDDDAHRRLHGEGRISAADSRVAVWVIPTDEEQVLVEAAIDLLGLEEGSC